MVPGIMKISDIRNSGINGSWLKDLLVSRKASEDMIDVNTLLIKHPEQSGVSTNQLLQCQARGLKYD